MVTEADSLFNAGSFLEAQVAYERLLFEGVGKKNEWLLKKAYCLKAREHFAEAFATLQRVDMQEGDDSLQYKLFYEAALNAYLAGKPDLAMDQLSQLHYYLPQFKTVPDQLLEILVLNQTYQFEKAMQKWESLSPELRGSVNPWKNKRLRLRNPDRAETISFLFPGAGQMYAGYWGKGLTSLAMQACFISFAVYGFYHGFYFSGAFTGVGLFYMFYNGGARHAGYLANKKNEEMVQRLNSMVLQSFDRGQKK